MVDTNGNGKRDAYVEPDQPSIPPRTSGSRTGFIYADQPESGRWFDLGHRTWVFRERSSSESWLESAATTLRKSTNRRGKSQAAGVKGTGFSPGVGYRPKRCLLDGADERTCRQFRSAQVQGSAERTDSATGQQCPEGWTLYPIPGPTFQGGSVPADGNYYDWVDQYDTFGMGKNVPIATGNGSDSLLALTPSTGKFTTLRVPYPMGFLCEELGRPHRRRERGLERRGFGPPMQRARRSTSKAARERRARW